MHDRPAPRRRGLLLFAVVLGCPLLPRIGVAQELEPRSYVNLPIGMSFAGLGYTHSEGGVATDPTLPIEGAEVTVDTAILAYARSLGLGGKSAKIDMLVPYSWLDGSADVAGVPRRRVVDGFADPSLRLAVNLIGAPALSPREFASYTQDLIVGVSLRVTAPLGQYDAERILNLGTNRWSFKPEVGVSKRWNRWLFDVSLAASLFTDNDDYLGGHSAQQAPLYSVQSHLIRTFARGMWVALDATWYAGGATTIDGIRSDNRAETSRVGLTLALPLDPRNSLKLYAATGVSERVGTDFDTAGVAWQYRWGGGR
jgi:hypothetical protein